MQLDQPDEVPVQPVQDKNYKKLNLQQLAFISIVTLYLSIAANAFKSSNMFRVKLDDNATDQQKQLYGDGTCNFDSNGEVMKLVYYTFIPVIIFRTYGAFMYRKRDNLDFKDLA